MSERVRTYYDDFDEWSRLDTPAGRLEYEQTWGHVSRRLSPDSAVLDLGGGPGRYSLALAAAGHRVSLVDPSESQIAAAQARVSASGLHDRFSEIATGCAQDLSRFAAGSFNAVLALGPFYHLVEPEDRSVAASELIRVLQPAGLAFVSFIPRLSGLAGLIERGAIDPEQVTPAVLRRVARDGVFLNPTRRGFQDGYFPEIDEIEKVFNRAGFHQEDLLSVRGLAFGFEPSLESFRSAARPSAQVLETILADRARDPSVVACGGHALLILRKPSTDAA